MAIDGGMSLATVTHRRLRPVAHAFAYPAFYLTVPLDRLDSAGNSVLSIDRFNLLALHRRDHGPRDGGALEPWIRALLDANGLGDVCDGDVLLHTHARLMGYAFNPVSFWFCRDSSDRLRAVLAEVNNTFGEHHNYLIAHAGGAPIRPADWLTARKVFHVSPFCKVEGHYRFRFRLDDDRVVATLHYHDSDGPLLLTAMAAHRRRLSTATCLRAVAAQPLMTLGVVVRIHLQALRLWRKRVRFFRKPTPPAEETTR